MNPKLFVLSPNAIIGFGTITKELLITLITMKNQEEEEERSKRGSSFRCTTWEEVNGMSRGYVPHRTRRCPVLHV